MIDLFKEKHIINDNYDFLKKPIVTIPKKSLDLKIKDWYNDNSKIYLMSVGKLYKNIVLGFENNIWGSTTHGFNSFYKINIGDIIITYCSDKENNLQGFHTIGKIISKNDPYYFDKTTWEKPYCCIVNVEWFNEPNKDNFFTLEETKPLLNYLNWGWTLRNGSYDDMSTRGWDINSDIFKSLVKKLTNY